MFCLSCRSRLHSILDKLELSSRLLTDEVDEASFKDILQSGKVEIDYEKPTELLKVEKELSLSYLMEALNPKEQ